MNQEKALDGTRRYQKQGTGTDQIIGEGEDEEQTRSLNQEHQEKPWSGPKQNKVQEQSRLSTGEQDRAESRNRPG